MKNDQKAMQIASSAAFSALICALSLCFMLNGSTISTNAETNTPSTLISTNAEIPKPQYSSKKMNFDDSIWGRLAKAIEDGINAWQD